MKSKLNKYDTFALGGIILLSALTAIICVIRWGSVYGSNTDWVSQHYPIPEYFRSLFYQTHELFPSYAANIGAGENIYALSYYGLYSPVILLSYLMPHVSMGSFMMMAGIMTVYVTDALFYFFLRRTHSREVTAAATALLAFSQPLLLHSHRHYMFIAFMPFLILSMFFADMYFQKGRKAPLVLSAFLMIMCNYFFAVTSLFAMAAYGLYRVIDEKGTGIGDIVKRLAPYIMLLFVSVLMSCVLILPTAYPLLSGRDDGNVAVSLTSFLPTMALSDMTYDSYPMGLNALGLFAAVYFIINGKRGKRFIGVVTMLFAVFPIFVYILNGTLYFDHKVLFAFLPMSIILTAELLEKAFDKSLEKLRLPLIVFLVCSVLSWLSFDNLGTQVVYFVDALITAALIYFAGYKKNANILLGTFVLFIGACVFRNVVTDELQPTARYQEINSPTIKKLIDENAKDRFVRTSVDIFRVDTPNKVYSPEHYQDTVYSSIHSRLYNDFYFKVFENENEYRNSALTTHSENLLYDLYMGERFIITDKELDCYGYELKEHTDDGFYLYENEKALPLVYFTDKLMSEEEFERLNFPKTQEALLRYCVVDRELPDTGFESVFESADIGDMFDVSGVLKGSDADELVVKDGVYKFPLSENYTYTYKYPEGFEGKIIAIEVYVDAPENVYTKGSKERSHDARIRINTTNNTLTDPTWKYFNGNNYFQYVLSDLKGEAEIYFRGGYMEVSKPEAYVASPESFDDIGDEKTAAVVDTEKTQGDVIECSVDAKSDGVVATSFVYQDGFSISVDGEDTQPIVVDKAFLGFDVKKGEHSIRIEFKAPWLGVGKIASIIGTVIFALLAVTDIKGKKKRGK
ncbi:MAG: YfhO family protein [Ruminococcus sp.]|nr:YfhO family protein [Ruminococcus sp.]